LRGGILKAEKARTQISSRDTFESAVE